MPKNNANRILLTGGHAATTALSVVEELVRRQEGGKPWDIYWVGSEVAVEGKSIPTLESKVFPEVGVKTFSIVAGRLQRRFSLWSIPSFLKIPLGFVQAFILLLSIRPNIILSFGGYAAFPIVVSGWILRIPIIIHEQTCAAGRANRLSAFFATKIDLAREESKKFFPAEKCVLVGNPVLTQIREIMPKEKPGIPPTIFITGGSRGAQRINNVVALLLPNLLVKYRVIHLTGQLDFVKFSDIKNHLQLSLRRNYELYSQVDPMKVDNLYREADLIIARAGANTVSEIMTAKRPAILIPIPWTYGDEQTKNAEFARKFGIAKVIKEENFTPQTLRREIEDNFDHWEKIVQGVSNKSSPDKLAAEKLVGEVEGCLS